MRKQIYLAICTALTEQVTDVKFIDLWNENITALAGGAAWPTPAVFVEFEPIQWRQHQLGNRRAEIAVRLHVITRAVAYNGSNDERQEQALAYFDLIDQINAAMQGLRGTNFAAFMLSASISNHNHDELIESVERFITSAQDTTAVNQNIQAATLDNLNVTIS